jgi:hypothetical protein
MDAAVPKAWSRPKASSEFETFYREHRDELYRTLAVILRNADLAQEAIDEAMIRAYANGEGCGRPTTLQGGSTGRLSIGPSIRSEARSVERAKLPPLRLTGTSLFPDRT